MTVLKDYTNLKENVEEAEREANKAEGALEQVMKRLKKEFGCTTLEAADKKYGKMKKQAESAKEKFEKAVEEFEEKWSDELEAEK